MLIDGRRYISLRTAAGLFGRSPEYLRRLIVRPPDPTIRCQKMVRPEGGYAWYVDVIDMLDYVDGRKKQSVQVRRYLQSEPRQTDRALQAALEAAGIRVSCKTIWRVQMELGDYRYARRVSV